MITTSIPGRTAVTCPKELEYIEYLDCLPFPELGFEIDLLDSQIEEKIEDMCFDLPADKRSDLAFSVSIERINNLLKPISREQRTLKTLSLEEIQRFRASGNHASLKTLELLLRTETKNMEEDFDPDISPTQNLISLLVARARANHGE